jgi:hypothetical protein
MDGTAWQDVARDHEGRIAALEEGHQDLDRRVGAIEAKIDHMNRLLWWVLGAAVVVPWLSRLVVHGGG